MAKLRRKSRFLIAFFFLVAFFVLSANVSAENQKIFKTSYCDIDYSDDKALGELFWRISGRRLDFPEDTSLARSRVDRLIDRVQSILDMYPRNFRIRIDLYPEYERGMIAAYHPGTNSIVVYADKVTDGVLAHELAHAVICNYFDIPPPAETQEILAQYVDKHLWDDY
jgi:hypothetical protein